jgi:hypothetical protein
MTHSNQSISPLRQRMIEDMTMRKLTPQTQANYLRAVIKFTRFFGQSPDLASPEDLRAFQLHLVRVQHHHQRHPYRSDVLLRRDAGSPFGVEANEPGASTPEVTARPQR